MRLLVVEDEIKLAGSLKKILEHENYLVDLAYDGEAGLNKIQVEEYDCLLLDINLPKLDGLTLCREIRKDGIKTPVIMLTARDTTPDKVHGLDVGADDYLVKPFAVEELLARIRAHLRRDTQALEPELTVAQLSLNLKTKTVKRKGRNIDLSAKEYALLEYLMRHRGQLISKETLLTHVWGEEVDPFSNVVDVYIGYLRKKIDKAFPKQKQVLKTVKGMGYRIG